MRLYTITTESAYAILQERGFLTGNARYAWRMFLPAYRWMAAQMTERIGPPPGRSRYPIWAWVKKPDLRERAHLPAGTRGYRLEIDIPDEQVVLSDFELWHSVLGGHYISRNETEDAAFETREREAGEDAQHRLRPIIEESWRRVFDVTGDHDPEWWGETPSLQATFWRLDRSEVKRATSFVAR